MNFSYKKYGAFVLSISLMFPLNAALQNIPLVVGDSPVTFVDSLEGSKTLISSYDRRGGEVKVLLAEQGFADPIVSREIKNFFRAFKMSDKKFIPESTIGKLFVKACTPFTPYAYSGKPLIDEINKGHNIRVILNNINELKTLISYLKANVSLLKVGANKPLLFIASPDLTALSIDEHKFLNSIFNLDASETVKTFFAESQKEMDEIEKSDLEYKTLWEASYHTVLKACSDFKVDKIAQNIANKFVPEAIKAVIYYIAISKAVAEAKNYHLISHESAKQLELIAKMFGIKQIS